MREAEVVATEDEIDARLKWRSRRGLLELELVLAPFVEHCLTELPVREKGWYARLLEHDDCDIYDWVRGKSEPADLELGAIIAAIRAAIRAASGAAGGAR